MPVKLAVFTKNMLNPAYTAARLGADMAARAFGAEVTHDVPAKPDNAEQQIALIDDALAAKPDAVVMVPVHPTAVNEALRKIYAAGIPVVGAVSRFTEPGPVSFVGSDDFALGARVAEYLFSFLKGTGSVVILEGPPGGVTGGERVRGVHYALSKFPGVSVAASVPSDYLREPAARAMQSVLDSGARFDAVFAANDVMALGALDVLEKAQRQCTVVGINAIPEVVSAIKAGRMLASADFSAMKMGYLGAEAALRHLRGETVPAEIQLPAEIVDRTNCAQWDMPYEERPLPNWRDVVRG